MMNGCRARVAAKVWNCGGGHGGKTLLKMSVVRKGAEQRHFAVRTPFTDVQVSGALTVRGKYLERSTVVKHLRSGVSEDGLVGPI